MLLVVLNLAHLLFPNVPPGNPEDASKVIIVVCKFIIIPSPIFPQLCGNLIGVNLGKLLCNIIDPQQCRNVIVALAGMTDRQRIVDLELNLESVEAGEGILAAGHGSVSGVWGFGDASNCTTTTCGYSSR